MRSGSIDAGSGHAEAEISNQTAEVGKLLHTARTASARAVRHQPTELAGYRWQDTRRPSEVASSGGSVRQRSMTDGQRGWNRQPAGGLTGLGTSPERMISSRRSSGCDGSAAENSAFVYGCRGFCAITLASPISTILPRYMTAMVWLM